MPLGYKARHALTIHQAAVREASEIIRVAGAMIIEHGATEARRLALHAACLERHGSALHTKWSAVASAITKAAGL
jgi:hypothetical protein